MESALRNESPHPKAAVAINVGTMLAHSLGGKLEEAMRDVRIVRAFVEVVFSTE